MSNLCIIPARGGSKRIPRKNIKDFLGKPIIAYSIETALQSGLFDEVMVSTDDEEIAQVAKEYGANVPFMRSRENADDFVPLWQVQQEVIEIYRSNNLNFKYVCCLLATSPLTTIKTLKFGLQILEQTKLDNIRPIVEYSYPIQRAIKLNANKIEMLFPEHRFSRSQDLKSTYYDAGQFYWSLGEKGLKGEERGGFTIEEIEAQDIDNLQDWKLAELKYRLRIENDR